MSSANTGDLVGELSKLHGPGTEGRRASIGEKGLWMVQRSRELRAPTIGGRATLLPLAAIESSFLLLSVEGPDTFGTEV